MMPGRIILRTGASNYRLVPEVWNKSWTWATPGPIKGREEELNHCKVAQ